MSGEGKRPNVYGISRDLWDHPIFAQEPFTEAQAWAWLVGQACWKDGTVRGNTGGPVELKRAEFSIAVRFLAERWQWSKDRAHRYLKKLEKAQMLCDTSRDSSQIYFISNYNAYQVVGLPRRDSAETPTATPPRQERDKVEAPKQENKKEEGGAAPVLPGLEFPPWWPAEAWQGYLDMRRKTRRAATDRAIKLVVAEVTKLRAAGHDPAAVLDQSTLKSWTDVYPVKGQRSSDLFSANRQVVELVPVDTQVLRLEFFHGLGDEDWPEGKWGAAWGPRPGEPGCLITQDALARFAAKHPDIARRMEK